MFSTNSRYYAIPIARLANSDDKEIVYVQRRFLPQVREQEVIAKYVVAQGDRLDNLTAKYLDDPELFWVLCDGNNAMRPEELVEEIGRRLQILLPMQMRG